MQLDLRAEVAYYPDFLTKPESTLFFDYLMSFELLTRMHTSHQVNGKSLLHDFGKLMFVNADLIKSGAFPEITWGAIRPWTDVMLPIKKRVESKVGHTFDVAVCIYYPDGNSGVPYHSDLVAFGDTNVIPSLSLGEEREFRLREIETQEEHIMMLHHGSLLIMGDQCQHVYEHSLPANPDYQNPRINITFRKYGFHD